MPLDDQPEPAGAEQPVWDDLQPVVDQELNRLPEKYRLVLVLCGLEGRSRKDVAHELDLPEGTLSSRLALARKMLAGRLARRGITLSASALLVILCRNAALHAASPALSAAAAAAASAAGKANAANVFSAPVLALARAATKGLGLARAAGVTMGVVLATLLGVSALGGWPDCNPVEELPAAVVRPADPGPDAVQEGVPPLPGKSLAYSDPEPPPLPPDLIATFESCDKRL
jgi:hypothetical protein